MQGPIKNGDLVQIHEARNDYKHIKHDTMQWGMVIESTLGWNGETVKLKVHLPDRCIGFQAMWDEDANNYVARNPKGEYRVSIKNYPMEEV